MRIDAPMAWWRTPVLECRMEIAHHRGTLLRLAQA